MKIFTTDYGIKYITQLAKPQITKYTRWIYNQSSVYNQVRKWYQHIGWIKPYYAIKSNPSPQLIHDIVSYNNKIGLDVASLGEMELALNHTTINNIIYTNPHTINHELGKFTNKPLNIKVIDSIGELQKIQQMYITPKILIRINSGNGLSDTKFDTKFGASHEKTMQIIEFAKETNMELSGISFHIGSGGVYNRRYAYYKAYLRSILYLEIIKKMNNNVIPIINFGGGLLYDTDLQQSLGWTKHIPYQMMAEPGRYFSEPSHHLLTQVIATTPRGIFLDNGIYHELNCYQRDNWIFPKLTNYIELKNNNVEIVNKHKLVKVFGPTCDSGDTINNCMMPYDINESDWIMLPNMGAYTNSGMVEFNGIPGASSGNT